MHNNNRAAAPRGTEAHMPRNNVYLFDAEEQAVIKARFPVYQTEFETVRGGHLVSVTGRTDAAEICQDLFERIFTEPDYYRNRNLITDEVTWWKEWGRRLH